MPLTKVQIISNALTLMGKKPIQNLINQNDIVTAADQAFDMLLPSVLSTGFWRFATTIVALNQVVPVPVGGYWNYAYQLPANYLKLVHLWPHNYDYEMYENSKMYSNFNNATTPLYLEYMFQPPVVNLPSYFTLYFIYELACYLSLSNAQLVGYYQVLEPKRMGQLGIALAADAQNRPQTPLQSQPILSRRYISTFASG
jgi:hypothetical protein